MSKINPKMHIPLVYLVSGPFAMGFPQQVDCANYQVAGFSIQLVT